MIRRPEMNALKDIRKKAIDDLTGAGNDGAALDVDLLLAEALACDRLAIYLDPDQEISEAKEGVFQGFLTRRMAHEPVSQILGRKEFRGLTFKVNRHCLTPRPDSEILIEAALKSVADKNARVRILDLGVGSGCLLLSLMSELPGSRGMGLDLSDKALMLARENAAALGLGARCDFIKSDWTHALPPASVFDIILCNPPYIDPADAPDLAPDVKDYEPHLALFASQEGYGEYVKLALQLPEYIGEYGHIFLEIGHQQGQRVREIFQDIGAKEVKILPDLAGRDRCLWLSF